MKKATAMHHDAADALAKHYMAKGERGTLFEVPVKTTAKIGEVARMRDTNKERRIISSRFSTYWKVTLFSAEEWLAERGKQPAAARK